ncbi:MAG: hypothetical protein AAFP70_08200 [Calditrichota bacterium]
MKRIFIILIALTISSFAQSTLPKASENYFHALKSDNIGVVESAVFNIVQLKLHYPKQNTDQLLKALNELSQDADSESLRYRAYLAASYLEQCTLRAKIEVKKYEDIESFFVMLADTMQEELLVAK